MNDEFDEFTPWYGGEMPVPEGTPIKVRHRDGAVHTSPAGEMYAEDWRHTNHAGDIVGYLAVGVTFEDFVRERHPEVLKDYIAYVEVNTRLQGGR